MVIFNSNDAVVFSVADPERFDPDPTFQADADQYPASDSDPKFCCLGREKIFKSSFFFFSIVLQNLSWIIFSVTMREEG